MLPFKLLLVSGFIASSISAPVKTKFDSSLLEVSTSSDPWDVPNLDYQAACRALGLSHGRIDGAFLYPSGRVLMPRIQRPKGEQALVQRFIDEYPLLAAARPVHGEGYMIPEDMLPKAIEHARSRGLLLVEPSQVIPGTVPAHQGSRAAKDDVQTVEDIDLPAGRSGMAQAAATNSQMFALGISDAEEPTLKQALAYFQPRGGYCSAMGLTDSGQIVWQTIRVPPETQTLQQMMRRERPLVRAVEMDMKTGKFVIPEELMPVVIPYAKSVGLLVTPGAMDDAIPAKRAKQAIDRSTVDGQTHQDSPDRGTQSHQDALPATVAGGVTDRHVGGKQSGHVSDPSGQCYWQITPRQSHLTQTNAKERWLTSWDSLLHSTRDIDEILQGMSSAMPTELPDLGKNISFMKALEFDDYLRDSETRGGQIAANESGMDYRGSEASTQQHRNLDWARFTEAGMDFDRQGATTSNQGSRIQAVRVGAHTPTDQQSGLYQGHGKLPYPKLTVGPSSQVLVQPSPVPSTSAGMQAAAMNLETAKSHLIKDVDTGIFYIKVDGSWKRLELVRPELQGDGVGPAYDITNPKQALSGKEGGKDQNTCRPDSGCNKRKHDEIR